MLRLKILPSFPHTFSPSKHFQRHTNVSYSSTFKPRSMKISSYAQTVEHIVLVNVKDNTETSKVNAMVNDLRSLAALDNVLHLTVGPVLRHRHTITEASDGGVSPELRFTHMLHSRYGSKEHLDAYSAHPNHIAVVRGSLFPVIDNLVAVDWISSGTAAGESPLPAPPRGSAIRVRLLRLKEGLDDEVKRKVLEVAGRMDGGAGEIVQLSSGENFSPERAKGFSVATLAVFPGQKEIDAAQWDEGLEKVKEHVESVFEVDYLVA